MVNSLAKNDDAFNDEDMDDVSYEKHRQLLQTITSKTKRKYLIFIIYSDLKMKTEYNLLY